MPGDWLARWNFDPILIGAMVLAAGLHALLLRRNRAWPQKRLPFALAWLLLVVLFVSPLCALSSALFSVRVAHHVILVTLIPLLAALALPDRWRDMAVPAGTLAGLLAVHAAIVWMWHEPSLYALALSHHAAFWLMQLSLFGTALLFWNLVLSPRTQLFTSITTLLAATAQMGLLGAIITFAERPLYAPHLTSTTAFGLTPLEDQQIAGLIMWVPAVLPYLAVALILLAQQLSPSAQVSRHR